MEAVLGDLLTAVPVVLWVSFVVFVLTKKLYHYMVSRGVPENVAVYYNRKIIHITAGGLVLSVPYLFQTPLVPLGLTLALTALLLFKRKKGRMYWFQTDDNDYEVHFTAMTFVMLALGYALGNVWYGVLPAAFMAIGDGVTGIIRNYMFRRRTKSWWGNLGMLAVCVAIGSLAGAPGIAAGVAASIVERYEFLNGKIDDNITVPLVSFAVLVALDKLLNP
ncbi:MAG: dolichol kinase [Crenarchaeota archaeon]|nr:dolichol kinase [Thermoproteota archaeon]